jgi:hypothetical protein
MLSVDSELTHLCVCARVCVWLSKGMDYSSIRKSVIGF